MKNIKVYVLTTIATSSFLLIGFSSLQPMEQLEMVREMRREEKLEAARAQQIESFRKSLTSLQACINSKYVISQSEYFVLINREFITNLKEFTNSFAQIYSDPELRCYHDQALKAATSLFTALAVSSEQRKFRCYLYDCDEVGKPRYCGIMVNALLVPFVGVLNKTGDPVLIELAKTIGKINFI